jgi:predicted dehydrogenase
MLKIGLMGCGTVAGYGHLPAIKECGAFELASLYDPDEQRLNAAQERFGAPGAFTDADAFFQSGIDAVAVTSPAPCHCRNVLDAARYGKHVLCEKPLATDEAECRRMIRAMDQAGVRLYTAFTYRFGASARKIKELMDRRAVGDVRALRFVYIWNAHGKYAVDAAGKRVIQKRREDRMLEGGPMVDCGTHDIDLARWWTGSEVIRWSGHGAWLEPYEAPDHMWLHMDHENGAHSMVEISYSYCHTAGEPRFTLQFELIGTEGLIRWDHAERAVTVRGTGGTQTFPDSGEKNFVDMYKEFARAVERGTSDVLATPEDGMQAVRIAREATEQAVRDRLATGKGG